MHKIKNNLKALKSLFALSFAICAGGIIVRYEPHYLVSILKTIGIEGISVTAVKIMASMQLLIGAIMLFISSKWLRQINKNQ